MRPTLPSAFDTARTSFHSSPRLGGGVSAPASRRAANAAWGKAGWASSAAACAAISFRTSRTARAVTNHSLPEVGIAQRDRHRPVVGERAGGEAARAGGRDQQRDELRGGVRGVTARADAHPVMGEHDPTVLERELLEHL